MEDGWIKWHRKSIFNPLFKDPAGWHLFEYCCLKANHKPKKIIFNQQEIMINRGQFIFGRKEAAQNTGLKPSCVYRRMRLLEKLQYLNIKPNNKFSIVTICNYGKYQPKRNTTEHQTEQQLNNNRTTTEQQLNTNKNVKNVKNVKNKTYIVGFEIFWKKYPNHAGGKQAALKSWMKISPDKILIDKIMASIEDHKKYSREWDRGYIPHATTWLNQGRWTAEFKEDEDDF